MNEERVLLLIPHGDDEVVGCAALIRQMQQSGTQFLGAYLTTGVPARDLLWPWERPLHAAKVAERMSEARAAAQALNIKIVHQSELSTRSLRLHLEPMRALVSNLLEEYRISQIWAPAFEGAHQDHDAANALGASFRARVGVWEFAEYNFSGGRVVSQQFPFLNGTERIAELSAEEQAAKLRLLSLYASEKANLAHIRSAREMIRPLPKYDYGKPPHPGRLFYNRFHWVPFRHPRVDFTPPTVVYAALARFAGTK